MNYLGSRSRYQTISLETGQRNDRRPVKLIGLPENKAPAWRVKVNVDDGQTVRAPGGRPANLIKDHPGRVLLPHRIETAGGNRETAPLLHPEAISPVQSILDLVEY